MKIGIITFHKALSYGSEYQSFALQQYLTKLGHTVEIIDYVPPRFKFSSLVFKRPKNRPLKEQIIKYIPFTTCKFTEYVTTQLFVKKHLTLSENCYTYLKDFQDKPLDYDVYVTGSDQVWNFNFDTLDIVKPYMLSFAKNPAKKISYAASIGMDSYDALEPELKKAANELLSDYSAISVRENRAVEILDSIGVKSQWVLDPTFLLRGDDWKSLAKKKTNKGKYIFVYGLYRNKKIYKFANKIAKENNLKVINLANCYDFNLKAKNKIFVSCEKLLSYLRDAECVVTDSFHGTALSINMNKPLYVFPALRYNSRLASLIELLGLQDRYVTDENYDNKKIEMDYSSVNAILDEERKKSYDFLDKAING